MAADRRRERMASHSLIEPARADILVSLLQDLTHHVPSVQQNGSIELRLELHACMLSPTVLIVGGYEPVTGRGNCTQMMPSRYRRSDGHGSILTMRQSSSGARMPARRSVVCMLQGPCSLMAKHSSQAPETLVD